MERCDACAFLSVLAQDELFDIFVSKELLKARDIIICEPHKVLDVLATNETRDQYSLQLSEYLDIIYNNPMFSNFVRKTAYQLRLCINNKTLKDCTNMYLKERCSNCPIFKREDD